MLEALSSQMSQAHSGTDVLDLAGRRLQWLQNRESVLAGNVANANTPGYAPKDIASFQGVLQNQMAMTLAQTAPGHLAGRSTVGSATRTGTSTSIDGNQVNIEGELEKIADTNDQQRLATNAYSVYMSMYSIALGSSSS
ncbi:flagellar biosynthesis protein FlgB [Gluconacetobacter sp. 1b LMG 1731]|uniref:Flagellar biosynthesis protein FlgB n=1 Tax=Gluconacetobacter dulcium TaxID=2729096 RepID=A0A7W4IHM5_9PROT|nr:flagellar basal body protein [Gluconacetobacter dulcium]MBB2163036.1 flagellar biosynthesis protein FlgB [Gluconacetobacter dulcium]MBB2192269.1 flagellar biosynthesis protein FlgB [Gluconacetobacter dulcium]